MSIKGWAISKNILTFMIIPLLVLLMILLFLKRESIILCILLPVACFLILVRLLKLITDNMIMEVCRSTIADISEELKKYNKAFSIGCFVNTTKHSIALEVILEGEILENYDNCYHIMDENIDYWQNYFKKQLLLNICLNGAY